MSLFNGEFTQEDEEGGITKAKAKVKVKACNCDAYSFPHRLDGGNCRVQYNLENGEPAQRKSVRRCCRGDDVLAGGFFVGSGAMKVWREISINLVIIFMGVLIAGYFS